MSATFLEFLTKTVSLGMRRAIRRLVIQRFPIVLADDCRNRPEQNRQGQNAQPEGEHDNVEGLVLQQANFLKDEERVVKLELPVPTCIFLEPDVVLPVNLAIKK